MTTNIAIEQIRHIANFIGYDKLSPVISNMLNALEMGIEALKYRDPQEVKRKGSSYYCPRCNNNLSSAVYIENKCCHECGQKLYWRPVDETKT